jgi:hypothetical protein
MKKFKEAAIALLTFKPYTKYDRRIEIALGLYAWLQVCVVIITTYLSIQIWLL